MTARFVAEEGPLKGETLFFGEGEEWFIGRDPDVSQILLPDASVSRRHVLCRKTPEGILLENLSITNPITINDNPIYAPQVLQNGDLIKIGDGLYRFHDDYAPPPTFEEHIPEEAEIPAEELPEELPKETTPKELPEEDLEERHDSIFEETPEEEKLTQISFDLTEAGRWLLKVVSGPNNGAEFAMQTDHSYTLGTDTNSCDIIFQDTSVSRQHARISISPEDEITIEDLKSRNGTFVDGEKLEGTKTLPPNVLVNLGTTAFVVYDREGEMHTIISPVLPTIAKILQKEEPKQEVPSTPIEAPKIEEKPIKKEPKVEEKPKKKNTLGAFILTALLTGLFVIVGIGITTLFKTEQPQVVAAPVNTEELISQALKNYPDVKYSFNKSTGRLLLVGHVISPSDKTRLMYMLEGISSIKGIDDTGIVIDEYVWREINQDLSKNPAWKSVSIYSPSAGHFVISGYLKTNEEAQRLRDYLAKNFPYLDLLENKILVEEEVMSTVTKALENKGFTEVLVQLNNGDLTLAGHLPLNKKAQLDSLIEDFKKMPGVRDVKNYVVELAAAQSMINISDKYEVTGFSHVGNINLSVVINGRILTVGSALDGMTITKITSNAVFLEKDGIQYRIDYNK